MSFRVTLHSVPRVRSYEDAVAFHDKAAKKPWRQSTKSNKHHFNDHAFPGKRQRQCGVRKVGEHIIFRLHNTDVITWRPDGSVRVEVYHSQSTCHFIDHFTPGISISLHSNGYAVRHWDAEFTVTPIKDDFTIFADGTIGETERTAFALQRVKRDVAKELRDTVRYPEFAKWRKIMEPLLAPHRDWRERWKLEGEIWSHGLSQCLLNEEHWPLLVNANMDNQTILANLYDNALDVYEFEYFRTLKWRADGRYINLSRYRIMRPA
jgi:hypothetical protein